MDNVLFLTCFRVLCLLLYCSSSDAQHFDFQPSFMITRGPLVTALLNGSISNITLNLQSISPPNETDSFDPASCVPGVTQWIMTSERIAKNAVQVKIYALLISGNPLFDNKTIIQNQVYRPLGVCPCDLTFNTCDLWCCCDEDCSSKDLHLFKFRCLPGPFGGQFPDPEYQCSSQSTQNSPDWYPFLCVTSSPENNPYLGLFYHGNTIAFKPGVSFRGPVSQAPELLNMYIEGSPILTINDQYFTIPQTLNGHCVNNAPVAFLRDFDVTCVTPLKACPMESPLQTIHEQLRAIVKNGVGGNAVVDVIDKLVTELNDFITSSGTSDASALVCENITLALDYNFYWKENGITGITLTRTVGSVTLYDTMRLTTRYSAKFLCGDILSEPNSGNPGYQVGRPVIGGILNTSMENNTASIARSPINLWKPVNSGLCFNADVRPVLFGENSTSGCLLPVSLQNLTECSLLRATVSSLQEALVEATLVARIGRPDPLTLADWINISYVTLNSSIEEDSNSSCNDIPAHFHIYVWTHVTGFVDGIPQKELKDVQMSYSLFSWKLECGGGDSAACLDPAETQLLPITSSATFIDIPLNPGPPKNRYQINFTEYDCDRNDVCWPELAFPMTRFYTGEPYSQALAKGLILVFFFIVASVLGTPWRQIRQIWISI
uniref:Tectonic domain-containing protein n=1 Tax=Knipowitschia caucasica TaxID=637954 RepID=A0AAV2MRC0_KNICA